MAPQIGVRVVHADRSLDQGDETGDRSEIKRDLDGMALDAQRHHAFEGASGRVQHEHRRAVGLQLLARQLGNRAQGRLPLDLAQQGLQDRMPRAASKRRSLFHAGPWTARASMC